MRLLPDIVTERVRGSGIELDLSVPEDLEFFPGHFPAMPILPGVVQIDWSVKLARARLGLRGEFARANNLKFAAIVWPRSSLTLALELDSHGRLDFRYFDGRRKYSSGTLVFTAP